MYKHKKKIKIGDIITCNSIDYKIIGSNYYGDQIIKPNDLFYNWATNEVSPFKGHNEIKINNSTYFKVEKTIKHKLDYLIKSK